MSIESVEMAPPNAVVLIADEETENVPETMAGRAVASTSSCVAVGVRNDLDGPTTIRLCDSTDLTTGETPVVQLFSGNLAIPSGTLTVESVLGENIFSRETSAAVHVTIFGNEPNEPSEVLIALGPYEG